MKALRSPLANQVLADPKARSQLRVFLGSSMTVGKSDTSTRIELRTDGRTVLYKPVVVPKA